nr:hypothetical protein [Pseudomonadota bacterium]
GDNPRAASKSEDDAVRMNDEWGAKVAASPEDASGGAGGNLGAAGKSEEDAVRMNDEKGAKAGTHNRCTHSRGTLGERWLAWWEPLGIYG